ncbi:MAG: sulfite reductase subunit alpha [Proteobacteria bacterium]|nr:MAG: sulfite reductase subunit alpha [Pseudomonadota bacterium]
MKAPFIPENAPFNEDQRAWISGFMAGLYSRAAVNTEQMQMTNAPQVATAKPLHILYGTQTGNAESIANDAAELAKQQGLQPTVVAMDDVSIESLTNLRAILVVISTYGEGEMPDNAALFWEALSATTAPRLEQLSYSVLALGDTGYDEFCQAGKLIDIRLEQLGARRIFNRVDCDVDYEDPAAGWINQVLPLMAEVAASSDAAAASDAEPTPAAAKPKWGRKNPYPSKLLENRRLSGDCSVKEIRHFAFDLTDSGLTYEAGDALSVIPVNDPNLVDTIIAQLNADPDQVVVKYDLPLRKVLRRKVEISTPSKDIIQAVNERVGHGELKTILASGNRDHLEKFLWGKDILDLLQLGEPGLFGVDEFVACLKPLQHRAYSISSSPKAHENEVHLTVAAVRWEYGGREHKGVCSTYMADHLRAGDEVSIFMSPNRNFRIPEDNDAPMIMVGPGTGIAPFRAFLEERREIGAQGKNWLFFGDQHCADDFIYEDELKVMQQDGLLTRLDLAFSRDQEEKIYVQTRMREHAAALYAWLQEGGYFYICGDATRMAKDVDEALHEIIQQQGGMDAEGAKAYVDNLKREKRYLRDVY